MIRGETDGSPTMADLMVGRIEPTRIATDAASFGGQGSQRQPRQYRGRPGRIPAIISGADPEECEMLYEYGDAGQIDGVLVRNATTKLPVARFDLLELTRLVAASGQCGVLFERQG